MSKEVKNICDACQQEISWKETAILGASFDVIYQTGTDPERPLGSGQVHIEGDFHYSCFDHEILRQVALHSKCLGTFWKNPIRESWTIPACGPARAERKDK